MAKNADILAKIQNFQFLHDRGLFICFLGREIDWYMLKFVKITRNHFFGHFWQKWPKISTFWPKNKISDFYMIGVYLYVFFGTRNSLVYVKICQDYQKLHFWPFWPKMAKLSFNWTLISLTGKKSKTPNMNVPGTSGFH